MRLLLEIFAVGALIYIGWEKSFSERIHGPPPAPTKPIVRSATTPSGAWMWDSNRQTRLDTPVPQPAVTHRAGAPRAAGSGSWMWDPNHHSPLDPPAKKSAS